MPHPIRRAARASSLPSSKNSVASYWNLDVVNHVDRSHEESGLELIHRLAQGDEVALEQFYRLHARFVYSLALSVVKSARDAEEVTQETFWRVWNHASRFDPSRCTVKGWLAMLTRRLAIDRTRSRIYKQHAREAPAAERMNPEPCQDSDQAHWYGHRKRQVQLALAELDESHREIIRLSYYEGMSHSHMAEALGTPLGTVKSRLREAIHQLRSHLEAST